MKERKKEIKLKYKHYQFYEQTKKFFHNVFKRGLQETITDSTEETH